MGVGAASYRRRAILNRIHSALDAFYMLQRIDWQYDIRDTIDKILATALEEIEFAGGREIERALLILKGEPVGTLEALAGWKVETLDMSFSRPVVHQAIEQGAPILCENAKDDPRFLQAESLKELSALSLICVPVRLEGRTIGALYIENHSPGNIFNEDDLEFLREFTEEIAPYLKAGLLHQEHVHEIRKLKSEIVGRFGPDNIIGRSEAMRSVFEMLRLASSVDRTVLITGDSGCGKELVARAIHYGSARRQGPLVTVDCSSLSEHLLESELFGHVKGSFTGASTDKSGAFEEADGGTVFLDEVSDAPRPLQQKLRRVIQEGEIRRVGETKHWPVNVRIICATNRSLPSLVESGEFMRDLYYRINKLPIHIPPLRERREDVPLLAKHFVAAAAEEIGIAPPPIEADALELLARLEWRENNVRQLRNVVELSVDLSRGAALDATAIERVLRIQQSEPIPQDPTIEAAPIASSSVAVGATPPGARGLVWIDREAFEAMLEASESGKGEKRDAPFYRVQRELAARAIIEGLRASSWKIRPAARRLGISPMKLRGELRDYITTTLSENGADLERAAGALDIPADVLRRKASDFGIEG